MQTSAGTTPSPAGKMGVARNPHWRRGFLTPSLMALGTLLWLIGSALFVGSQPRLLVNLVPTTTPGTLPTVASSSVRSGSLFTAAWVLWIISSCFWILGSFLHLLVAHAQAALVTVQGLRPAIASWTITAAWMQLISTILVLIGGCVFAGGTLSAVSAGAILLLIGFTIWGNAILIAFGIAYIVSTTVVFMPEFTQRQYAWSGIVSLLFLLVQYILFNLASVLLVVRDPPGIWLTAGLLYLVGSFYGLVGWSIGMRGTYGFFTPVLGYATAAGMSSGGSLAATGATGAVVGGGGGAVVAAKGTGATPIGTTAYPAGMVSTGSMGVRPAGASGIGATPIIAAPPSTATATTITTTTTTASSAMATGSGSSSSVDAAPTTTTTMGSGGSAIAPPITGSEIHPQMAV